MTVSSSAGDITIDSVKDHLGSGEDLTRRISGLCVTKTITTIVNNSTIQEGTVTQTNSTTTTTTSATEVDENSECGFLCFVFQFMFLFYNDGIR